MKTVTIESPFKGETEEQRERNLRYLDLCILDSIHQEEAPFASHYIYPNFLDDNDGDERQNGIEMGYAIAQKLKVQVFYIDLGWSDGMMKAFEFGQRNNLRQEIRTINASPEELKFIMG